MSERWPVRVRFGGLGGQGLVTLGAVLAQAGASGGLRVAASQSYGSQARGGTTHADVILSDDEIDFPHVIRPDVLIVMAREAYDDYLPGVSPGGLVLVDDFFVEIEPRDGLHQMAVAATATAVEQAGNKLAANFVILGALVGYTAIVESGLIESAIRQIVRERFHAVNLKAFGLGLDLGRRLAGEGGPWR